MKQSITLFALLLLFSCSQEKQKMIVLDKSDYSVSYPEGWEMKKDQDQVEFLVSSPVTDPTDDFAENFNLLKQDISGKSIDLQRFDSISIAQIISALGEKSILESKDVEDHHIIIFKGPYQGRDLKWKQVYFIKNETAYVLTYTGEQKNFDKYSDIAESIFNSFKLK